MKGNNNVLSNKKIMKFCTPIFPHKKKECFPQPFNLAISQKTKSSSILYLSQKDFDTINVKADTFWEILLPLRLAKYYTFNRHSAEEVIRCLSNSPALPDDLGVLIRFFRGLAGYHQFNIPEKKFTISVSLLLVCVNICKIYICINQAQNKINLMELIFQSFFLFKFFICNISYVKVINYAFVLSIG
jgi:hypothetical protein